MTSSLQVRLDIPDATQSSSVVPKPSRRRHRRRKRRGMVFGYYVCPCALLENLRKKNAVVSENLFEVTLEFKKAFCQSTNRPGTSTTFVPVAGKGGYCVILSKGPSRENEIQVLKELLETDEEPKWYQIDPEP
jgi:hypothetical protein